MKMKKLCVCAIFCFLYLSGCDSSDGEPEDNTTGSVAGDAISPVAPPLPDESDEDASGSGAGDGGNGTTTTTPHEESKFASAEQDASSSEVEASSTGASTDELTDECEWKQARTCQVLVDSEMDDALEKCATSTDWCTAEMCELGAFIKRWDAVQECFACTTRWKPDLDESAECEHLTRLAEVDCMSEARCSQDCAAEANREMKRCDEALLDIG